MSHFQVGQTERARSHIAIDRSLLFCPTQVGQNVPGEGAGGSSAGSLDSRFLVYFVSLIGRTNCLTCDIV